MGSRYYETSFELDGAIEKAAEEALEAREHGSMAYDSAISAKVGAAVEMYDGEVFAGFNRENPNQAASHAEELAIAMANAKGYRATDFRSLVIVFVGEDDARITVPCQRCQTEAWQYTHPKLNVVEVGTNGEPLYRTTLDELVAPPGPEDVSPFPPVEWLAGRSNDKPRLAFPDELVEPYKNDERFRRFCDAMEIGPES